MLKVQCLNAERDCFARNDFAEFHFQSTWMQCFECVMCLRAEVCVESWMRQCQRLAAACVNNKFPPVLFLIVCANSIHWPSFSEQLFLGCLSFVTITCCSESWWSACWRQQCQGELRPGVKASLWLFQHEGVCTHWIVCRVSI